MRKAFYSKRCPCCGRFIKRPKRCKPSTKLIGYALLFVRRWRYHRLIANPAKDGYEIGAAFPKEKDGMEYFSVSIDSPALPAPINAALFLDKEGNAYNLMWNRQDTTQTPKAEATVNVNLQPHAQEQVLVQPQGKRKGGRELML